MGLRQFMQGMCALPAPHGIIWHDPGFPSLLVTYKVANDFFFSGHTTIAVLGAYEVSRLRRRWLTVPACMVLVFEILTVLSLRVHYTMDVFTGIVTALLVSRLSSRIAPAIDHRLLGRQQVKDCNGRISGLSSAQKSMPQVDSTRLPARSAATNSASF
jgi:membrane-associated phospholipid phosphatase